MSILYSRYQLESENHFSSNKVCNVLLETPSYHVYKSQTRLTRFEIFPKSQMFCNKLTPLNTTQSLDLSITNKESFNMDTDERNPFQLPEDELSTRLTLGKLLHPQTELHFADLNSSKNF